MWVFRSRVRGLVGVSSSSTFREVPYHHRRCEFRPASASPVTNVPIPGGGAPARSGARAKADVGRRWFYASVAVLALSAVVIALTTLALMGLDRVYGLDRLLVGRGREDA